VIVAKLATYGAVGAATGPMSAAMTLVVTTAWWSAKGATLHLSAADTWHRGPVNRLGAGPLAAVLRERVPRPGQPDLGWRVAATGFANTVGWRAGAAWLRGDVRGGRAAYYTQARSRPGTPPGLAAQLATTALRGLEPRTR
jgi:hypothetical protein